MGSDLMGILMVTGIWMVELLMVNGIFWVNCNDLTATSLGIMVNKGNHPQMAARFRLVKYSNLPRILLMVYGI